MIPEKLKKILKKQHYEIVGKHSAVQICRWTKNSLRNEGVCYKEQFYGINSHLCCQMTPAVMWCQNKCLHCWRAIELTIDDKLTGKLDSPKEIIDGCILAQRKLIKGFKILPKTKDKSPSRVNMKKWEEAQEPTQFAISLSGEPTLYEKVGELIEELRRRGKTSFLVTNGLYPEKIKELMEKKQLPTQLYVSVNSPNKKLYVPFHRSSKKDAWEKLNESLSLFPGLKGKTRTVFRMNLVKDLNMKPEYAKEYAEMIKKYQPLIVEVKGFMSVGFARQRLGYDKMPTNEEMKNFIKLIEKELTPKGVPSVNGNVNTEGKETGYKLLDNHERSRAFVLGKDKKNLKITQEQI